MGDGIHLRATATVPANGERHPVILTRTYTDRRHYDEIAELWCRHGFAFVAQDVRGKYDSEGTFHPYTSEGRDGADTIRLLAAESWCDGTIVLEGGSYGAFCALSAAAGDSSGAVAALAVLVPATGLRRTAFPAGLFQLYDRMWWNTVFAGDKRDKQQQFAAVYKEDHSQLLDLPVSGLHRSFPLPSAHWEEIVNGSHAEEALDWRRIGKPGLHIGGWNDVFIADTLAVYEEMKGSGQPQALIVGPWAHDVNRQTRVHVRDYGPTALIPLASMQIAWYRQALGLRADYPYPPVLLFVMTANRWVAPPQWPLPDPDPCRFYLFGDGTLGVWPQAADNGPNVRRYIYDPLQPFPTRDVPLPRNDLERRGDCLVFTTGPLEQDLLVAGTPEVSLYVSSTAPATDFFATLTEVLDDGSSVYVTHGYIRLPAPPEPERRNDGMERRTIRFPLRPLCQLFPLNGRLRLTIASSSFPRYARHLNTPEDPLQGVRTMRAEQSVWMNAHSFISLPVHSELLEECSYEFKRRAAPLR